MTSPVRPPTTLDLCRFAVDVAPAAMLVVDAAGLICLANARAEALFGHASGELLGLSVETLVPQRYRTAHVDRRASFFGAPTTRPMGEGRDLRGLRKDGREIPIEIALNPVDTNEGKFVLTSIVDLTERQRTAAMQRKLEFSDRLAALGTMAAGVAHEVNNPLAAVAGNVGFAESEIDRLSREAGGEVAARLDEPLKALADARQAVEQIARIVSDLRTFTRPSVGLQTGVDVDETIRWATRIVEHQFRNRARLVLDLAAVPPVLADEARLGQVFVNLLVNAAQAIEPGCLDENVVCVKSRLEGDHVVVEVEDSGHGMAEEVLRRIFEPFFTTKDVNAGTGLGLSICHAIVHSFGGEIDAASQLGDGATFRVRLPVLKDAES